MSRVSRDVPAICVLLAIIAVGAYLRLAHLDAYDLIQEELSHVHVGESIAQGNAPVLPSGQWYTRGIVYSRLVEMTRHWVESPELAVRLPSALLGTLCLVVMAVGAWAVAGPWAAVGATLLLALYPDAVMQSRLGRFYMLQMLYGLLAIFGGWIVLQRRAIASTFATWVGAIAVTLALLVAASIQVTALPTLFAWWLCLTATGIFDLSENRANWRRSVPLQASALMLLTLIGMAVVDPTLVDKTVVRALSVPVWARVRDSSLLFYILRLTEDYVLVVALAPLAYIYLLRTSKIGLYLLAMFAIPAIIFSFALPFKAERFMLLAFPPLFLTIAIAAAAAFCAIRRGSAMGLQRFGARPGLAHVIGATLVVLLVTSALFVMRAPHSVVPGYWNRIEPDWRRAGTILKRRTDLAGIPYGATKSLPPRFYWGRIDFNVGRNFLEQWGLSPLVEAGVSSGRVGSYVTLPIGSPDLYAGVPVVTSPESIRARFGAAGGVVIGVDGQARYFGMVGSDLLRVLSEEGEELCKGECGSLYLYLWRFR